MDHWEMVFDDAKLNPPIPIGNRLILFSAFNVDSQVHLSEPEHLFKFLSLLWGYSNNLSDQLEFRVTALLQTQALYVSKVLLSALPVKKLNILASPSSTGTETYSPSSTQNAIFLESTYYLCSF